MKTEIRPGRLTLKAQLEGLWSDRRILWFFVWRDLKVRYKQTALGAAWAVLQPLSAMLIFTVFWGRVASVSTGDIPYPLFAYSALVPWLFFANGLGRASNSLIDNAPLVRKAYFARLTLPVASVLSELVDLALAFSIFLLMMLMYHRRLSVTIFAVPLFVGLTFMVSTGMGLWLAALNVRYRDVRYVIPFLLQLWMFATPIVYPAAMVPARWRFLVLLNPMAGAIDGYRWAVFGGATFPTTEVLVSAVIALILVGTGVIWFGRTEAVVADIV